MTARSASRLPSRSEISTSTAAPVRSRTATHGLRDMLRAAVGHVVAIDHGDDGVLHAHLLHRLGHASRLVGVGEQRLAFADRAERAAARADLAEDHERGGAGAPALEDVRAARFLADGVQRQIVHQRETGSCAEVARDADLEPLGTDAVARLLIRAELMIRLCSGPPALILQLLQRLAVVGPADPFIRLGERKPAAVIVLVRVDADGQSASRLRRETDLAGDDRARGSATSRKCDSIRKDWLRSSATGSPAWPVSSTQLAARGGERRLAVFDRAGDRLPEIAALAAAMKKQDALAVMDEDFDETDGLASRHERRVRRPRRISRRAMFAHFVDRDAAAGARARSTSRRCRAGRRGDRGGSGRGSC